MIGVCVCVCLSVCLFGTFMHPVETAELVEMPFGGLTHMHTGQGRTNPFSAARGDKMAMWPFVKIL